MTSAIQVTRWYIDQWEMVDPKTLTVLEKQQLDEARAVIAKAVASRKKARGCKACTHRGKPAWCDTCSRNPTLESHLEVRY